VSTSTPAHIIETFAERVGAGDLDGAVALYDPAAVFLPAPDVAPVSGTEAIRDALRPFADMRPTMRGKIDKVVETSDTALVVNRWELTATQRGGEPVEMRGVSADVLRRGPDGTWRILIDDPWGGG
jgi:ketosteroid isomerase-like protein